jgi:aminoglycoside phosphotransferase (APT) family kinase protein
VNDLPGEVRAWVERSCGRVTAVEPLSGATTAAVQGVAAGGRRLVLKRFVHRFFVDEEPDRATHEAAFLRLLAATDVPVPRLVAVDPDGSECGVPAVLMTRLPGRREVPNPNPAATADVLARVHRVRPDVPYGFVRYQEGAAGAGAPTWASHPALWERALGVAASPGPGGGWGLIHRDANDGNMLWEGSSVSGVVDWLSACRGPLGIDLARVRLDMVLRGEQAGAEAVLGAYRVVGVSDAHHPHWDIVDAVDLVPFDRGEVAAAAWPGTPDAVARRERLEGFLAAALAELG